MAVAMTIGAGKIKIMQESALASMPAKKPADLQPRQEKTAPATLESGFT